VVGRPPDAAGQDLPDPPVSIGDAFPDSGSGTVNVPTVETLKRRWHRQLVAGVRRTRGRDGPVQSGPLLRGHALGGNEM